MARLRRGEPGRDGARPELGDDPVPLHLDQPDPGLRLPGLVAGHHRRRARPRDCGDGRADPERRLRRRAALGRAVRGTADVGDVPGDGLACAPAPGRGQGAAGRSGRARRVARPAEGVPPRRLARAAHARDDRARSSRAAAASERLRRPGSRDRARRARSDREHPGAAAAAGQVESAGLRSAGRDRRRAVPRGHLPPLVRGRPARVEARWPRARDVARRPRRAAHLPRRPARERRQAHRARRCDLPLLPRRRRRPA